MIQITYDQNCKPTLKKIIIYSHNKLTNPQLMKSKQSYKVALKVIHVFPLLKFGTKVLKNMKDKKVDNFSTVA